MSRFLSCAGRLAAAAKSLWKDRDGGIAILFGLSLVPLVGLVGFGVDYGMAVNSRAQLDRAADAAALAAVVTAKSYVAANSSQSDVMTAAVNAGKTQAVNTFNVNIGNVPLTSVSLQPPQVKPYSQMTTAELQKLRGEIEFELQRRICGDPRDRITVPTIS